MKRKRYIQTHINKHRQIHTQTYTDKPNIHIYTHTDNNQFYCEKDKNNPTKLIQKPTNDFQIHRRTCAKMHTEIYKIKQRQKNTHKQNCIHRKMKVNIESHRYRHSHSHSHIYPHTHTYRNT